LQSDVLSKKNPRTTCAEIYEKAVAKKSANGTTFTCCQEGLAFYKLFFQKYRHKLSLFGIIKVQKNRHICAKKTEKDIQWTISIVVGLRLSFIIRTLLVRGQHWLICKDTVSQTVHKEKNYNKINILGGNIKLISYLVARTDRPD
jgi:hypothetical protein